MKYYSHKIHFDGKTFDSKKELKRYGYLTGMQMQGKIKDLRCQVRFEILPRLDKLVTVHLKTKDKQVVKCDEKAKYYTADFVYMDVETGKMIVEDVKSKATASVRDYPLRRHLMKMLLDKMNDESADGVYWEFKEVI